MMRRLTRWLVVHCAATPPHLDIGAAEIALWHRQRGYDGIGYHYVIRRNGVIERGRPEGQIGAHVKGHNADSIAVCLVGGVDAKGRPEDNFTAAQWASLKKLLRELAARYPGTKILGHRDFPKVAKACPCFDAIAWARKNGLPAAPRMRPTLAAMLALIPAEREDDDERDDLRPGQDPATPPPGWGEAARKPVMQRRSFWRDVTGGTMLTAFFGSGVLYGMDGWTIIIILTFVSLWAAFFIWMFRREIFGERR